MTVSIAIIGNSRLHIGMALAGDLALGGHDVRFAPWPDQLDLLDLIRDAGGITITAPAGDTLTGKNGQGTPRILTADPAEAIAGADLVILDVHGTELDERAAALIPLLENGQVLYISTHGYWPALRLAPALRAADKAGVTIVEGTAPNVAVKRTDATIPSYFIRQDIPVAVFPANRLEQARRFFPLILPTAEVCRDVLETNLENINLLVHPAMTLLNIGYFDRCEAAGEPISFYGTGNTPNAGRFAEALDAERPAVCEAYGVRFRSLLEHIHRLYGGSGDTVYEAVQQSPVYKNTGALPASIWRAWAEADVPLAHVPFTELAESAGLKAPLHRGFVDIIDCLLGMNSWRDGLNLERLGLAGMGPDQVRQFLTTGEPPG